MPYTIRKSNKKGDPRPWQIIRSDTGKVVGTSKTRAKAIGSMAHRMDYEKQMGNGMMTKPISNKGFFKGRKKSKSK